MQPTWLSKEVLCLYTDCLRNVWICENEMQDILNAILNKSDSILQYKLFTVYLLQMK